MKIKTKIRPLAFAFAALAVMASMAFLSMQGTLKAKAETQSQLRVAVLSDTHYYPESYMSSSIPLGGRTLLAQSPALFDKALELVAADNPDILLISGDLTRDGEEDAHLDVASKLEAFESQTGVSVYVVAGNHDVNNPNAYNYKTSQSAYSVSPNNFKNIYANLGYDEAASKFTPAAGKQAGGLSYAVELDGFTLLAIDSNKYSADVTQNETNQKETGGIITDELLEWIEQIAQAANERGDAIIAFQHHGVVKHFESQDVIFGDYLVDDFERIAAAYADMGIRYIFTGHNHANDIAKFTSDNENSIYDIETGSLVSYPSPYRICDFTSTTGNKGDISVQIQTKFIESVTFNNPLTQQSETINDLAAYTKPFASIDASTVNPVVTALVQGYIDVFLASGGFAGLFGDSELNAYQIADLMGVYVEQAFASGVIPPSYPAGGFGDIGLSYTVEEQMGPTIGLTTPLLAAKIHLVSVVWEFESIMTDFETQFLQDFTYIGGQISAVVNQSMTYDFSEHGSDKTLQEALTASYAAHVHGEESTVLEPWVDDFIAMFSGTNNSAINALVGDVIRPILVESVNHILGSLEINLNNIITSPSPYKPMLIAALETMMGGNATVGGIMGMVGYDGEAIVDSILTEEAIDQLNNTMFGLLYSMAHDTNHVEDNNTLITESKEIIITFVISFRVDGGEVYQLRVREGEDFSGQLPVVPVKEGYIGSWDKTLADLTNITSSVVVNAVYVRAYTVTFLADEEVVKTVIVEEGKGLSDSDMPKVPSKSGFNGMWDKTLADLSQINADTVVNAVYTESCGACGGCSTGCGCGSIDVGSSLMFLSFIALAGCTLFVKRKSKS